MVVQVAYAACTARMMAPEDFGAYAVALSGAGLVATFAGTSAGQAASRSDSSADSDRTLLALVAVVAPLACLVTLILAPAWAHLWGVPGAVGPTWVLAVGLAPMAYSAVLAGFLRREGRTSLVAARTALGQLVGMALGLIAVALFRQPWTLSAAATIGWFATSILLARALGAARVVPKAPTQLARADLHYSVKSAGLSLLRQLGSTLPPWSVGRFAGAAELGVYNRATTLITLPIDTVQRSLAYALFPELRPGSAAHSGSRIVTDLVVVISWASIVLIGIGYPLAAPAAVLILGPDWVAVQSLAGMAFLLGFIPTIGVPIATALESKGAFRSNFLVAAVGAFIVTTGIVATKVYGTATPAMGSMLIAATLQTGLWFFLGSRNGLLSMRGVWLGIRGILLAQVLISVSLALLELLLLSSNAVVRLIVFGTVGLMELLLIWIFRRRTRLGKTLAEYGLLRAKSKPPLEQ